MEEEVRPVAFVIMPFDNEFGAIYSMFIAEVLQGVGFEVLRADNIVSQRNIVQDIVEQIDRADLIVADLTTRNPNVFYELGIAHGLGKKVLLLAQDMDEVPFDLRAYRILVYDTNFATIQQSKEELREIGQRILRNQVAFGSPVQDYMSMSSPLAPSATTGTDVARSVASFSPAETQPDEEAGLLDYMVDFLEGYKQITEIAERITASTSSLTEEMTASTERLGSVGELSDAQSARQARTLVMALGTQVMQYAEELKEANREYHDTSGRADNALEQLIALPAIASASDADQLDGLAQTMHASKDQIAEGMDSLAQFAGSLAGMPRIERSFDRAVKTAREQLELLHDNLEGTYSTMDRAERAVQSKVDLYRRFQLDGGTDPS